MKKITQLKKHLGFLIYIARTDMDISQEKLAKMVKTKQPSIARAEKNGCDLEFCLKCVEKMGFTLDENALRAKNQRKKGLTFHS